ncbi:ankyrin repeat domain-containing protein [bacterium]|nr:MAG: ankyrin repeat domain-containing protein [bacterium]
MNKKKLALFLVSLALTNNALPASMKPEDNCTECSLKRNGTRLHNLARKGEEEQLQELLAKKIFDVNAVDEQGNTPLHLAAQGGHTYCCLITLWRAGADRHLVNNDGDDAVTVAEKNGHHLLARTLQEKYDNHYSDDDEKAENIDTISPEDEDKLDALFEKMCAEKPIRLSNSELPKNNSLDSFDSLEKLLSELKEHEHERKLDQEGSRS